jgi:type IV pilus assembly protein PilA
MSDENRRAPVPTATKVVVGVGCGVLGLGALAVAGFFFLALPMRGQGRSKTAEAKSNLKAFFTSEKAYFAEKDTYSPNIADIGFSPERGNRFVYFIDRAGPLEDRSAAVAVPHPGDRGVAVDAFRFPKGAVDPRFVLLEGTLGHAFVTTGTEGHFVAVAAGNIDDDATLDVWSVSDEPRRSKSGEPIPAGEPFNEVNDVMR